MAEKFHRSRATVLRIGRAAHNELIFVASCWSRHKEIVGERREYLASHTVREVVSSKVNVGAAQPELDGI